MTHNLTSFLIKDIKPHKLIFRTPLSTMPCVCMKGWFCTLFYCRQPPRWRKVYISIRPRVKQVDPPIT